MTHTFSKSAFYSFGDIPLSGPLPLIFSQLREAGRGYWSGSICELGTELGKIRKRSHQKYRLSHTNIIGKTFKAKGTAVAFG
jgi:hypothetical protein